MPLQSWNLPHVLQRVDPGAEAVGSVRLILAAAQKYWANARVSVGPCALFRASCVGTNKPTLL